MNVLSVLKKYWKAILGVVLLLAALLVYQNVFQTEKAAYEAEKKQLNTYISALQASIQENARYAGVQDDIEPATAQVLASRLELYEHFPVEMKEEDQIMYVLYLETLFDTEISFAFSQAHPITVLRDGSTLMGLVLTVNYETTYQGFQKMVNYLATDSRITSVQSATIEYDAESDTAIGDVTLLLYLMDSEQLEYEEPNIAVPDTGKTNVFD